MAQPTNQMETSSIPDALRNSGLKGSNKSFDKLCTTMKGPGVSENIGDGTFDDSKSPLEKPSSFTL